MRQCSYDGGKAILAMVMVQSIYAAITILTKQALREGFNVMVFVAYKQGLAFLILFTASILLNRGKINHLALGVKGFSWVFVAAIFCTTITQFCYYQGLNLTSSSMATAMLNLIPGVTFLISLLFGLEKLKLRSLRSMAKIFGTLICIAGAMCMALYKGSPILQSSKQNFMLGCILLFANIIGWSSWLILQDIICRHYLDPLSVTVWVSFLAAISSAILTWFIDQNLNIWKIRTESQLIACLFSGIFGTTVTYYLQAWIIAARGPLFSAVFNPLTTVITTTFTFLLLHENLYVGSLVGAIAVIVGLYIVLWGKGADYGTKTKLDQKDDSIEEADVQSDLHEPLVSSTRGVDV
ncbi:WAT1-related protein At4g28040-like isoform X1 [Dioscorea cayenensis subsp. rotundata]|uniref:WAT1-related protein n=1 Tax=Dioscorea cayennensis subsp. rotundata TaxID=55577 RepID=A0AB40BS65_DIOCR|nr:WAT1-related protein At4g28040-like isoform X1 [Dioscorea cayenensis subsp. rotundata]